jgi:hypothetical protein
MNACLDRAVLDRQPGDVAEAVARKATDATYKELHEETRRKTLRSSRGGSADPRDLAGRKRIERAPRPAADAKALLGRRYPQARQMLRKLIDGRIAVPVRRCWEWLYMTVTGTLRLFDKQPVKNGGEGGLNPR